jgi:molybdate transport system substrate-binding protein
MLLAAMVVQAQTAGPPVVAAASDLEPALTEVAKAFKADSGQEVVLKFGASGDFAGEIEEEKPPYQVFFSADESYVQELAKAGKTRDAGTLYAVGRLAIMVPAGSPLKADGSLADLKAALSDQRLVQFAIANPVRAPYGKRAEEALRHQGIWEQIEPKLTLGDTVFRAAQMATSKNFEGGIIAYSLALDPEFSALGSSALIPDDWHSPLRQRVVLLKEAGPVAEQFYAYVQQPATRAIFAKHGFRLPGESP